MTVPQTVPLWDLSVHQKVVELVHLTVLQKDLEMVHQKVVELGYLMVIWMVLLKVPLTVLL